MEEQIERASTPQAQTPGLAVAALVCGICGIVFFIVFFVGFVLAVLAVVFGAIAKSKIDGSRGLLKGRGLAVAGLVCGVVSLGLSVLGVIIWIAWIPYL